MPPMSPPRILRVALDTPVRRLFDQMLDSGLFQAAEDFGRRGIEALGQGAIRRWRPAL